MTTNKPEVVAWYFPSSKTTLPVVSLNAGNGQPLIRLSDYERLQADHEAAINAERQIGFAAAFDILTWRSANTDNDVLAEELNDLAHDLLESAPDWKDRWKQIHKMNAEHAADKALIAELGEELAYALADFDAWASHEDNHPHDHLAAWSERARAALAKTRGDA